MNHFYIVYNSAIGKIKIFDHIFLALLNIRVDTQDLIHEVLRQSKRVPASVHQLNNRK